MLARIAQRFIVVADSYASSEMANHAAAGAYSFLLSAAPASLVIFSAASVFMRPSPEMLDRFLQYVEAFIGRGIGEGVSDLVTTGGIGAFAAVFGAVNLVWASRLFVLSVQRGIRVVWAGTAKINVLRENVLTFVAELVAIFLAVAIMLASAAAELFFSSLAARGPLPLPLLPFKYALSFAPVAAMSCFVYLSYRFLPPERPTIRSSAIGALACTASFAAFSALLALFVDAARYDLLYGVLGHVIAALINVYTFFSLYFFFAGWVFATENFDALLLCRCVSLRRPGGPRPNRLGRKLFLSPARLFERYLVRHGAGQVIFNKGDDDTTTYFVLSGEIGIHIGRRSAKPMSRIGSGEFFGEMAGLLGERRTATAAAECDTELLAIPPKLFERFLAVDRMADRRIAEKLSERLRNANERAARVVESSTIPVCTDDDLASDRAKPGSLP